METILIVSFDAHGIIHHKFVLLNTTVNKEIYKEVLKCLRARTCRVCEEFYDSRDWFLLHDNAPAHTAIILQQYLAKRGGVICLSHQPYSPDLPPPYYFIFPKLKMTMKGKHYTSIESIQEKVTRILRSIPQEDFIGNFNTCMNDLKPVLH